MEWRYKRKIIVPNSAPTEIWARDLKALTKYNHNDEK